jgi:signal peptidase I
MSQPGPQPRPTTGTTRWWRYALELVLLVMVALVGTLLVKNFIAQAFSIPSSSMEPQLEVGDRVLVSRLSYRLGDPNRGDIVVFHQPDAPPDGRPLPTRLIGEVLQTVGLQQPLETELIKRIVGLPGEEIEAADGTVHVDGRPVIEPYLPGGVETADFGPVLIPDGHVFVLGDNRGNSADSRVIGPVSLDSIVGRAIARVWPPQRMAFL